MKIEKRVWLDKTSGQLWVYDPKRKTVQTKFPVEEFGAIATITGFLPKKKNFVDLGAL